MSDTLTLTLISPEKTQTYTGLKELVVPGSDGIVGILPQHAHMIIGLKKGTLQASFPQAPEEQLFVRGGTLLIEKNTCTLVTPFFGLSEESAADSAKSSKLNVPAIDPLFAECLETVKKRLGK